ncbi:MAG: DMT family transporter [Promethearchaeota archaeon]
MKKIHVYLIAILANIIWGTTFPLSKLVIPPLSGPVFTGIRVFFGLLVFFIFLFVKKQIKAFWHVFKSHLLTFFILGSIFYALSYAIQYYGIRYTTAINQSILYNTETIWVILLNIIFFKRKPDKKFIIGMFLGIFGAILILVNDNFSFSTETIYGDIISLLSVIIWAAYLAFSKPVATEEKSLFVITSIFVWALAMLIPLSFINNGFDSLSTLSLTQWGILIYLGAICSGIATLLYTKSFSHVNIPSENIAIIGVFMPVVSIITSILILGESFTLRIAIGIIIVITSVLIVEYEHNSKNNDKQIIERSNQPEEIVE